MLCTCEHFKSYTTVVISKLLLLLNFLHCLDVKDFKNICSCLAGFLYSYEVCVIAYIKFSIRDSLIFPTISVLLEQSSFSVSLILPLVSFFTSLFYMAKNVWVFSLNSMFKSAICLFFFIPKIFAYLNFPVVLS